MQQIELSWAMYGDVTENREKSHKYETSLAQLISLEAVLKERKKEKKKKSNSKKTRIGKKHKCITITKISKISIEKGSAANIADVVETSWILFLTYHLK